MCILFSFGTVPFIFGYIIKRHLWKKKPRKLKTVAFDSPCHQQENVSLLFASIRHFHFEEFKSSSRIDHWIFAVQWTIERQRKIFERFRLLRSQTKSCRQSKTNRNWTRRLVFFSASSFELWRSPNLDSEKCWRHPHQRRQERSNVRSLSRSWTRRYRKYWFY